MKTLTTNYLFNAAAKTVTFLDYLTSGVNLERILLIVNTKTNTIIYNFADTTKGGSVATNVLTLTFDTSLMHNTDPLLIYYDEPYSDVLLKGEDIEWDHIVARPVYLGYYFNAFTSGQAVGVQGKRLLGRVIINKPGAPGTTISLYNNYYTPANPVDVIDGTVVGLKEYGDILTNGLYIVVAGIIAAPDFKILLA